MACGESSEQIVLTKMANAAATGEGAIYHTSIGRVWRAVTVLEPCGTGEIRGRRFNDRIVPYN
jgi:hypothetical protein